MVSILRNIHVFKRTTYQRNNKNIAKYFLQPSFSASYSPFILIFLHPLYDNDSLLFDSLGALSISEPIVVLLMTMLCVIGAEKSWRDREEIEYNRVCAVTQLVNHNWFESWVYKRQLSCTFFHSF